MAIASAILGLLAVLIPALIGYRVDTAPTRRRERVDASLIHSDPSALLSELFDETSGPSGQPNSPLPGDRPSPV
jgi:hypothetical protein